MSLRKFSLSATQAAIASIVLGLMMWATTEPVFAQAKKAETKKGRFVPEIKPAPLTSDSEERSLPDSVGEACVGGGGRFIILTLPKDRKIAIFDVNEAKVVKYIPVDDDNPSIAANMDKLVVSAGGTLTRYSLETLEKEMSAPFPGGRAGTLLMGSASRGPLVALVGGVPGFIDPNTLKPLSGLTINVGRDKWVETATRISGDGRVLTTYKPGSSPQGQIVYLRSGSEYKAIHPDNHDVSGHFTPGPESKFLYSAIGVLTSQGKPVGKLGSYGDGSRFSLPAVEGETFYLRIDVPGFPHGDKKKVGTVYLHLAGDDRPIAALDGVKPPGGLNHWGREKFGIDKRFFLIPSAQLLVVLPDSMDRLELHKVDPGALLEKADFNFLLVMSQPPHEAFAGKTFTYEPVVKSKKGGVKLKLATAPKGMKVDGGQITWDVPPALAGKEVDVTLTISDDSGKDIFHSFKMRVRGGK